MRGKRILRHFRRFGSRDHPRGCGENAVESKSGARLRGSPPRMRGKQGKDDISGEVDGITPADAGKTKTNQRTAKHDEDHPRGCGENIFRASF